jgi:hypothetical protein
MTYWKYFGQGNFACSLSVIHSIIALVGSKVRCGACWLQCSGPCFHGDAHVERPAYREVLHGMEAARPERGQLNALKLAPGRLVEIARSDGDCKETGAEELTAAARLSSYKPYQA